MNICWVPGCAQSSAHIVYVQSRRSSDGYDQEHVYLCRAHHTEHWIYPERVYEVRDARLVLKALGAI